MSQDEPSSRKDKKAQRDAERHKKGSKKRKHAEVGEEDAVPAQDVTVEENAAIEPTKKSRKRKAEDQGEGQDATEVKETTTSDAAKPKKRKKAKTESTEGEEGQEAAKPAKSRFIVFVGNLPYKTTDDLLQTHFKKLQPFTLRHRTDPKTKKSKGFAFLEFENYDRMKTCLKLYHHSMFDPEDVKEEPVKEGEVIESRGRKRKSQARRINVELTAGGGGKTDARKDKIKAKNERLDEQRKRRAEAELKEKARKAKKEQKEGAKGKKGEEQPASAGADAEASHGIHPSRLAQLNA